LCPEDPESLSHSSWFADEEICRKRPVPEWVKRQRRIAKKLNFDNERGCFTKKMLERKAKISFKMHGVDPSKGPPHKQEEKWLKNHPGPSKKTATARAFNAQESHHGVLKWTQEQARTIDYGEISLTLKFHDGQLRHIEKRLMHNEKPDPVQAAKESLV